MRTFFLPDSATAPAPGDEILLDAEESRHALQVLRLRHGTPLRLVDGRGLAAHGELAGGDRRGARVRVDDCAEEAAELGAPRLVLACGLVKGRRFEWLLEKAVELGVHTIRPLRSEHAEVDPRSGKRERWRQQLRAAVKQCGRSWLPDLVDPATPAEALSVLSTASCFYGAARERDRGAAWGVPDAAGLDPSRDLVWFTGPEGGWSPSELELLRAAARPLRLGPHVLRAETAALAGLARLGPLREILRGE